MPNMTTETIGGDDDGPRPATLAEQVDDLRSAYLETNNQFQRLILLMGERGHISPADLAYVTGEGPKPIDEGVGTTSEQW